jgi:hypothetical protein
MFIKENDHLSCIYFGSMCLIKELIGSPSPLTFVESRNSATDEGNKLNTRYRAYNSYSNLINVKLILHNYVRKLPGLKICIDFSISSNFSRQVSTLKEERIYGGLWKPIHG